MPLFKDNDWKKNEQLIALETKRIEKQVLDRLYYATDVASALINGQKTVIKNYLLRRIRIKEADYLLGQLLGFANRLVYEGMEWNNSIKTTPQIIMENLYIVEGAVRECNIHLAREFHLGKFEELMSEFRQLRIEEIKLNRLLEESGLVMNYMRFMEKAYKKKCKRDELREEWEKENE